MCRIRLYRKLLLERCCPKYDCATSRAVHSGCDRVTGIGKPSEMAVPRVSFSMICISRPLIFLGWGNTRRGSDPSGNFAEKSDCTLDGNSSGYPPAIPIAILSVL